MADILLMLLDTEVIGMVAVCCTGRGSPFVYPILIAALLLAVAAVIIVRAGKARALRGSPSARQRST